MNFAMPQWRMSLIFFLLPKSKHAKDYKRRRVRAVYTMPKNELRCYEVVVSQLHSEIAAPNIIAHNHSLMYR